MLWKVLTAISILFWAVMTGMLLRNVYFPSHSSLAQLPPERVLEQFLDQAAARTNALQLFQGDRLLGHSHINALQLPVDEGSFYRLTISGGVSTELPNRDRLAFNWRLEGDIRDGTKMEGLEIHLTVPASSHTLSVQWDPEQEQPRLELRQGGTVVLDSQGAQALGNNPALLGPLGSLLTQLPQSPEAGGALPQIELRAREDRMELAGKTRNCRVLEMTLLDQFELRALFTEVGELARVDLPQGYRLLEPLIHGLEPDLVETE